MTDVARINAWRQEFAKNPPAPLPKEVGLKLRLLVRSDTPQPLLRAA